MEIHSASPETTSGTRGPSPRFIQGRHERMRTRLNNSTNAESEDAMQNSMKPNDVAGNASPTAIQSFRQLRAKRKTPVVRVPGGAAAKLIGKAPVDEDENKAVEDDDECEDQYNVAPISEEEFILARDQAKSLFETGPRENKRYHADETPPTQKKTPVKNSRVLNREEVLPENATEAVLSLIGKPVNSPTPSSTTPIKRFPGDIGIAHSHSRDTAASARDFTKPPAMEAVPRNAFQAPSRDVSKKGDGSILEPTANGSNPLEQPLLSKKAEKRVAQMKEQMQDPNSTIANLINTIASPEGNCKEDGFLRGYMVRRKNACGALQVLTTKAQNRISICWTLGILPALSSVLEDSGKRDLSVEFPDTPTRKEFVEARKRAVGALTNLSIPPQNRLAIFHTPRMVSNIVNVIRVDQAEARKGCCGILAQLAKTKENRLLMVQVPDLVDTITSVIEPKVIVVSQGSPDEESENDHSSHTPDNELLHSSSNSSSDNDSGSEMFSSASYDSMDDPPTRRKTTAGFSVDITSVPTSDPAKASRRYDEDPTGNLQSARTNLFALLLHLVKEKDNAFLLARHKFFLDTLVEVSKLLNSTLHEHAVKLIAHLTRHRGNSKHIVFKVRKLVPAMVKASLSSNDETRKYACFALQNLSQDKPCRQELAVTDGLLGALCARVRQATDPEERLSAIQSLANLTNEPANLIPMTNTPECFASLMQIAHAGDESVTEMMQFLACDALATLSHWFRSIATSGHRIGQQKAGVGVVGSELFVPSLKIVGYEQWQ